MKKYIVILLIICSECFADVPPKYNRPIDRWNWVPAPIPNHRPDVIVIPVPVPASSISPFSVPLPLKDGFQWFWWRINTRFRFGKNDPAPA